MDNLEVLYLKVRIKQVAKYNYRIESIKDGICLGAIINGVGHYLEFRNEFSAKSYIERDKKLILVSE